MRGSASPTSVRFEKGHPAKGGAGKTTEKRKNESSEATADGGVAALAGFVNQMLGSAADFAICVSGKSEDAGGFKTLIRFETERYGQDSSATGLSADGNRVRVLKQYKYSANPEKYKISKSELQEIVATLKRSAQKANKEHHLTTHLVLCTNRQLTKPAQKCAEYKKIHYEPYHASTATDVLESYARRFGVFNPDELSAGVQRATYHLFNIATSSSHSLSKSRFDEALIGHRDPQSIVLSDSAPRRLEELSTLGEQALRLEPDGLADRENLRRAATEFLHDGIVAFVGDGGCGKTTAIWQLLLQAISTQPPFALSYMMISNGHTLQSIGDVIERWRGIINPASIISDEFAMERLVRANPSGPRPIFLLGLDGIDEVRVSSAWADTAARVLNYFWHIHVQAKTSGKDPVARLFVSCRDKSDVERLLPDPSGTGMRDLQPRYVHFGEFTSGELQQLAWTSAALDERAAQRITQLVFDESQASDLAHALSPLTVPLARTFPELDILKHPILWRSFASLSAQDQNAVLDGSAAGKDKLGAAFLKWFCNRAKRRIDVHDTYLSVALRAVASGCPELAATYRLQTWVERMRSVAGFTDRQAIDVYYECVSSGLVQDIPPAGGPESHRSWRWKHVFLAAYLRGLSGA